MKTLQEIYDEGFIRLIEQGQVSEGCQHSASEESCSYTDDNGLHCIVGGLLPADCDTKPFEGFGVNCIDKEHAVQSGLNGGDFRAVQKLRKALLLADIDVRQEGVLELLAHMQRAHDAIGRGPVHFKAKIRTRAGLTAAAFDLDTAKVEAALKEKGI